MSRQDCDICRGAGKIRLPVYRRASAGISRRLHGDPLSRQSCRAVNCMRWWRLLQKRTRRRNANMAAKRHRAAVREDHDGPGRSTAPARLLYATPLRNTEHHDPNPIGSQTRGTGR